MSLCLPWLKILLPHLYLLEWKLCIPQLTGLKHGSWLEQEACVVTYHPSSSSFALFWVSRLGASENCGLCQLCNTEVEDPLHAFFTCQHSQVPGHALLGNLQTAVPNLTPEGALKLQFETSLNNDQLFVTVCLLSSGLNFIWKKRSWRSKSPSSLWEQI